MYYHDIKLLVVDEWRVSRGRYSLPWCRRCSVA